MKKYSREELFSMCSSGNIQKICEELYNAHYSNTELIPLHSGDKFIMNKLRKLKETIDPNNTRSSIVIIKHDIPCLVIHRSNDKNHVSISEVRFPFQGDNVCSVLYKIHNVRDILDTLSYDNSTNTKSMIFSHLYF